MTAATRPEILGDYYDTINYYNSNTQREDFHVIKGILYKKVERMPVFQGCEADVNPEECSKKKLIDLLYNNIRYPAEAKKLKIQGVVYAKYIIRPDGTIGNPRVERGIGGGCDEEVLRFISLIPKYTPGYHEAKAVPVQVTLPVKFKLMR